RGDRGESHVVRADEEEAPEEERLDVGARVEDVAREDDTERERADEREPGQRLAVALAAAREAFDAECVRRRGERGAGGRRPAEPGGHDEAREGRRPDGMGEESEAAEDEPRPGEP